MSFIMAIATTLATNTVDDGAIKLPVSSLPQTTEASQVIDVKGTRYFCVRKRDFAHVACPSKDKKITSPKKKKKKATLHRKRVKAVIAKVKPFVCPKVPQLDAHGKPLPVDKRCMAKPRKRHKMQWFDAGKTGWICWPLVPGVAPAFDLPPLNLGIGSYDFPPINIAPPARVAPFIGPVNTGPTILLGPPEYYNGSLPPVVPPIITPPVVTPPGGGNGAVPEPASWMMMVAGFGAIGYAMRRRKASFAPR